MMSDSHTNKGTLLNKQQTYNSSNTAETVDTNLRAHCDRLMLSVSKAVMEGLDELSWRGVEGWRGRVGGVG